jgi:excisionase family DNA binding protein
MSMSGSEPPRLVTCEEAARLLGIGRSLAWQLISNGTLISIRLGRRRLVPIAAIDQLIEQQLASDQPQAPAAGRWFGG